VGRDIAKSVSEYLFTPHPVINFVRQGLSFVVVDRLKRRDGKKGHLPREYFLE